MKKYIAGLIFLIFSFGLIGVLSLYTPYLESLELKGYDFMMATLRGPLPAPEDIIIVAIDETSLAEFEDYFQWPWPRSVHGQLIRSLNEAGVQAIIFDVVFAGGTEEEEDGDLADAIGESRVPVILAAAEEIVDDPRFGTLTKQLLPFDIFIQANAKVGYATFHPDLDQILRQTRLAVNRNPSLSMQAFYELKGSVLDFVDLPVSRYQGEDPELLINYTGGSRHIYTVSYYQAIDHQIFLPPGLLKDKIVFVGRAMAVEDLSERRMEKDYFPTPFGLTGSALMPGVEVHANALTTLLRGDFIHKASPAQTWILLAFVAILVSAVVLGFESFRLKIVLSMAVIIGYVVGVALLFVYQNYWLYTAQPLFVMLSVFGLNTLYQYRQTEKERAHIRKALKGYVSRQVMDQIMQHPDSLELGGTQVEATVLFSDIVGFSKISEKTTPRDLFSMLNDYFTKMGDVIMKQEGMINKYIGDSVMAIWNTPMAHENHGALACQAALEMKRIVDEMAPLRARVGINTGPMVAGNLGHSERMEYTVIGDAVNLASRLEGANKALGSDIMISESTEQLVRGQFLLRPIDRIRVIGKEQPVQVYEVLAGINEPVPDELHEMVQSFEKIVEAYEARDWIEASNRTQQHLERFPEDKVASVYLERCLEFSTTPPPADWDGVYALKSK
ncbi:adenylate/guanylate cyclase domain-containing protein [Acidobacteria bacterium AH-259-D05]|nr:adenylate/guanylate cyclase domain-containing protein [Acidobacteria bacterium AH-259-D05]